MRILCFFTKITVFIGNFGTVFVDQSYWQSSIATKPKKDAAAFLAGGLLWFAVPFTFATTMGIAYIAFSAYYNQELMTSENIDAGKSFYIYINFNVFLFLFLCFSFCFCSVFSSPLFLKTFISPLCVQLCK